jgi:glycosyltransferase involved in cell wall biosynthesis
MNFSVVIPTYKRPDDLKRCLTSVFSQSVLPTELIVVDDDALSEFFLRDVREQADEKGVVFVYLKKSDTEKLRGSSQSRNLAIEYVSTDVMVVLDDDIVLSDDYFLALQDVWIDDELLLGVGGVIINNRSIGLLDRLYRRLFGLSSTYAWDVNVVGYQVWDDRIQSLSKGYYAHGGLFAYNVQKLKELNGFTEFSEGRNALEDVDFFLRAKQAGYYTLVEPLMRAHHKHSPVSRESAYQTGFRETANRIVIFKDHCAKGFLTRLWFEWATIGWIFRQVLAGNVRKAYGMFTALLRV